MHHGLAIHKPPYIGRETAEGLLDLEKPPGVIDGGAYFLPMADNPRVAQERGHLLLVIARHLCWIEMRKGKAILFPLPQHGVPTQSCLGSFQEKALEQAPVVMDGHSPFAVVIIDVILFGEIHPRTPAVTTLFLHQVLS